MIIAPKSAAVNSLYHPGISEIRPIMQKAMDKAPSARDRLIKAEQILLNLDIDDSHPTQSTGEWAIRSQTGGHSYHVRKYGCDCGDWLYNGVRIGKHKACKHTLALRAYIAILESEIARLVASGRIEVINIWADHPHRIPEHVIEGKKVGIVEVECRRGVWRLKHERAAFTWAKSLQRIVSEQIIDAPVEEWLPYTEPVAEPAYAPQWQPTMTQQRYQHWLDTGEVVPAHVH